MDIASLILAVILFIIISLMDTVDMSAIVGVLALIALRLTDTSKNHMVIYGIALLFLVLINAYRHHRSMPVNASPGPAGDMSPDIHQT